jgi:hypothetical protein
VTETNKINHARTFVLDGESHMPEEIFDVNKFIEISERAEYCNIKRLKQTVKLKLRTQKKLITLKVDPTKAEEIVKKLRCEIREI